MISEFTYQGSELELFRDAKRWKSYFASHLRSYVQGHVLEVGAGIGATTKVLCTKAAQSWTCLEPDGTLAAQLEQTLQESELPVTPEVFQGTLTSVPVDSAYDTILYIDVLEHIESDRDELANAAERLSAGGHLVVLSPAFEFLFSEFDRAVGHFRRYDRNSLLAVAPPTVRLRHVVYLDSAGLLLSLANRLLLRKAVPTANQIRVWDTWFVGASNWLDRMIGWSMGRSIIGVWQKPGMKSRDPAGTTLQRAGQPF